MRKTAHFKLANKGLAANHRRQLGQCMVLVSVILLSTVFLHSCAHIRKVTYPRDFVYLEHKEVNSQMALLGLYVRRLDEILNTDDFISPDEQQQVLEILSQMSRTADTLGAGNVITNHLIIDAHIDQFKADVDTAIYTAKAVPPHYFIAGQLSGSCVACHGFR